MHIHIYPKYTRNIIQVNLENDKVYWLQSYRIEWYLILDML